MMNDKIMNGSGQGLRRFELLNGQRVWIDTPTNEWQKYHLNPRYPNKQK